MAKIYPARSNDSDPFIEGAENIREVLPDVRMKHEIGAVVRQRDIRCITCYVDYGKAPALFQLHLPVKRVVDSVMVRPNFRRHFVS